MVCKSMQSVLLFWGSSVFRWYVWLFAILCDQTGKAVSGDSIDVSAGKALSERCRKSSAVVRNACVVRFQRWYI